MHGGGERQEEEPMVAKRPQGAPRHGKVWDGEPMLVEYGGIRTYVGDWADAPGGQASE